MVETALEKAEHYGVLLLEPRSVYDKALVDVITTRPLDQWLRQTDTPCAVYSRGKCIDALMEAEGWDYEGAVDWYEFNTSGAWVGEGTPTFLSHCDNMECLIEGEHLC